MNEQGLTRVRTIFIAGSQSYVVEEGVPTLSPGGETEIRLTFTLISYDVFETTMSPSVLMTKQKPDYGDILRNVRLPGSEGEAIDVDASKSNRSCIIK